MRAFNKLFVVSLPRCATVSMSQALGMLDIPTAHLGKIYCGTPLDHGQHHDMQRIVSMFEQVRSGDPHLEVFTECRGLADYPACCLPVLVKLREHYPHSLFINVRRDRSLERWLQSVEQQFVGLELLGAPQRATTAQPLLIDVLRFFRQLTFGQADFAAAEYLAAYHNYQTAVDSLQATDGPDNWLQFEDAADLEQFGFARLCDFLQMDCLQASFPRCDEHSRLPEEAFRQGILAGTVISQTGP